ncbi:MAG: SusD/RagB family nutrient-binding outer membrane lipoprotein, partial [Ferruginibacter sp.]|nr:SusD/RagB family nutrient-binding outer membrane lipoprotein [Ferruginibacter sp.]
TFSTGSGIGNSGVIPLRYQYPSDELATNGVNAKAAIQSQYAGNDDINAKMWIIK